MGVFVFSQNMNSGSSLKLLDYNRRKKLIPYIINILLNIIVFVLLYGVKVLDVTNISWLTGNDGGSDLTQHYLGWAAYRKSDWTFPLGLTKGLCGDEYTSIFYTDSLPVCAVFFKIFRGILPAHFQYFGLWGFITYILMAFFSTKICNRYNVDAYCSAFICLLISFNPIILWRMYFHTALASHWIILWAIYILLSHRDQDVKISKRTLIQIMILGILTVSTMVYLLLVCGLILLTFFIYEAIKRKDILPSLVYFLTYCLSALFCMWVLGAFGSSFAGAAGDGLELYGFNLNSFYNPMIWGSLILPGIPTMSIDQDIESYMYLGAGVLLMMVILLVMTLIRWKEVKAQINMTLLISMIIVSLISIFIALSPMVTFNDMVLVHYSLPKIVFDAWSIFRSIARVAWVVFYFVIVIGTIAYYRIIPKKAKSIAIVLVFAVQLIDISPLLLSTRYTIDTDQSDLNPPLTGGVWAEIEQNDSYDEFVFFSVIYRNNPITIYPVTEFAIDHDMTVNQFFFSREGYYEGKRDEVISMLSSKDATNVYIFTEEELTEPDIMQAIESSGVTIYDTDGFYVGVFD